MGTIIVSALVAHTAWHWMIDRFGVLRQFPWPTVTAADAASAIRWVMALIVVGGVAWLLSRLAARKIPSPKFQDPNPKVEI